VELMPEGAMTSFIPYVAHIATSQVRHRYDANRSRIYRVAQKSKPLLRIIIIS